MREETNIPPLCLLRHCVAELEKKKNLRISLESIDVHCDCRCCFQPSLQLRHCLLRLSLSSVCVCGGWGGGGGGGGAAFVVIIITFKGPIRDYLFFLQSPHCAVNRLQHVRSSGPGANHMQHIQRSSRATHPALITCNTSSTHHVQHIQHSSRATHPALITCNTSSTHHVQHIQHSSRATRYVPHGKNGKLSHKV